MRRRVFWLVLMLALGVAAMVRAQQAAWLQIEAQPTLRQAEARARAYAGAFPNVQGYALRSGWYAIVLGPYDPAQAAAELSRLQAERLVPPDSFIADGSLFRGAYWPAGNSGQDVTAAAPLTPAVPVAPLAPVVTTPLSDVTQATGPADSGQLAALPAPDAGPAPGSMLPDETPAEARASEATLDLAGRQQLQQALRWYGFYDGAIDGAIGPGTRGSMAAWQNAQGHEDTGILTTAERKTLVDGYTAEMAALGLAPVDDNNAGISIDLPLAMVGFTKYAPPFAHYEAKGDSGVSALLISEPGDQTTLAGLYDIMQTLAIVPVTGERSLQGNAFDISGQNDKVHSFVHAQVIGRAVKGYALIWKPGDDVKMAKVLAAMKESFRSNGDAALDATMVAVPEDQKRGLLAGLELRKPVIARSGFYVDAGGDVLTTSEVVKQCKRISFGADHAAKVVAQEGGMALLRPDQVLAPLGYAHLLVTPPRLRSEVAVAGFSYAGVLNAATLSFGTLEDVAGLNGETDQRRVTLTALPGDAGGPVIDASGGVIGLLLPRADASGKVLPEGVNFAAGAEAITALLQKAGVMVTPATEAASMAPEDLTALGADMTVLVSCWN